MYPEFRILIVDDYVLVRSMMKNSLGELGFSYLEEAGDGVEALSMMEAAAKEKKPYSVVFLDWNMPRMTGLELIEKCKSMPELADIPIIVISAERETENVLRALESGALDFITKPFSSDVLREKLFKILIDDETPHASNG